MTIRKIGVQNFEKIQLDADEKISDETSQNEVGSLTDSKSLA
jgi:hypothetical protein